jgi:hypothetical protein
MNRSAFILLTALVIGNALPAASAGIAQPSPAETAVADNPVALVRRAAANELRAVDDRVAQGPAPVRFLLFKQDEKGSTLKEVVQTRDGSVARLVSINGKPLTAEQKQLEAARLQRLLDQPDLQERRRKREKDDAERAQKIIHVMPDAFVYKYAGTVSGPNGPAIRLTFEPKPGFDPPDQETRVAVGIRGELWIDQAQERMVRLDAQLFEDVDFGWGILGRLYKGGSIRIENADVGNHNWQLQRMKLDLSGKALMVKSLTFRISEHGTDYESVPREMSYKDGIRLLQSKAPSTGEVAGR